MLRAFSLRPGRWAACAAWLLLALLAPAAARAGSLVGLTDSNRLVLFDSTEPERIAGAVEVSGLQPGELLLGIDIRPANGRLYAVGSTSRLYTLDTVTGAATQVGPGPFAPALNVSPAGGFEVGMTFDALQDRIRVVSNGQSLRLDPDSGTVVALDGPLFYAPNGPDAGRLPRVTGLAHDTAAPRTTLFGIDWQSAHLVTVGSRSGQPVAPTAGEVFRVGPLFAAGGFQDVSVKLADKVGFDIVGGGLAYATLTREGASASRLHVIDLKAGLAYEVGAVGTGAGHLLRGLAALPEGSNLYALTATNKLLLFNAYMPGAVLRSRQVTGLQNGETLLALDARQKDGFLYSVANTGRFYRVAPDTGAATPTVSNPVQPPPQGSALSLARDTFRDQMRLVSDADQTWQFGFPLDGPNGFTGNPFLIRTGALRYAADDPAAGQNPRIVGLFTDFSPEPSNFLVLRHYGIDADRDTLVFEQEPDLGVLRTIGPLGFDAGDDTGLDNSFGLVFGGGGEPYASLTLPCPGGCAAPSTLFRVSLQTGRATPVGGIGGDEVVRDIVTAPEWTVHFSKAAYRVTEDCTSVELLVIRTGTASGPTTVEFRTGGAGTLPAPAADPRADYTAASGTLRFAADEPFKPLRILITEDTFDEKGGEAFNVTLGSPRAPVLSPALDGPTAAAVLIEDDGDTSQGNSIDDTQNFVCQHYHDFLNREPDDEGFAFWINVIESCGADAQCREVNRINVSAAFFLSIEFQETGFFVYRMYQAAFGRLPNTLTFEQFTRDARRVGEGVVVHRPGALERLEANKQAFVEEFISRPEFLERYPFFRSNEAADFVGSLDANSGFVLSPSEREELLAAYAGGAGRKLILRRVVEDEDFKRMASNRAFVLSQYFGYLRRNPDDPPDADFSGYDFWLGNLEKFNGNFVQAELVKAFITSFEYRRRFGPE